MRQQLAQLLWGRYYDGIIRTDCAGQPQAICMSKSKVTRVMRDIFSMSLCTLSWRWLGSGLIAFSIGSAVGCGDGKIARYPVTGTVLVDGRPAEGATVIFCPIDGPPELMRERPFSQTDSSGRYELRTLEPGDGAPAGEYNVMVRWLAASPQQSAQQSGEVDRDRGGGGRAVDRLRGKYFNPETSGLKVTVEEQATEVPPFELTAKPS